MGDLMVLSLASLVHYSKYLFLGLGSVLNNEHTTPNKSENKPYPQGTSEINMSDGYKCDGEKVLYFCTIKCTPPKKMHLMK